MTLPRTAPRRPARSRPPARAALLALALLAPGAAAAQDQAQAPAPKVVVSAARSAEITRSEQFVGRGVATDAVDLVARVSGFLEEVAVEDGASVAAGQVLFRIEPDGYEATRDSRRAELSRVAVERR